METFKYVYNFLLTDAVMKCFHVVMHSSLTELRLMVVKTQEVVKVKVAAEGSSSDIQ